jgi:hypothetical protein
MIEQHGVSKRRDNGTAGTEKGEGGDSDDDDTSGLKGMLLFLRLNFTNDIFRCYLQRGDDRTKLANDGTTGRQGQRKGREETQMT